MRNTKENRALQAKWDKIRKEAELHQQLLNSVWPIEFSYDDGRAIRDVLSIGIAELAKVKGSFHPDDSIILWAEHITEVARRTIPKLPNPKGTR